MLAEYNKLHLSTNKLDQSFCDIVEKCLKNRNYEDGQIESVESEVESITSILSRLFLKLVEKQVLNINEIEAILKPATLGYNKNGEYKWPFDPQRNKKK